MDDIVCLGYPLRFFLFSLTDYDRQIKIQRRSFPCRLHHERDGYLSLEQNETEV